MSRVLKRPMFKMGGSTSGGITSGLKRARYVEGERVTTEDILREYGPAPRSSNVYDFLIDFGLNIASMPPQGNIISTAAAAARDPFSRFQEGKSKGDQLAYAMRAQAADKARDVNLSREKMDLQKYLGELQASKTGDSFLKLDNRPNKVYDMAKVLSETGNTLERTHPIGMAEYESIRLYDKIDVQLAPLIEDKGSYAVDIKEGFKPEDVNKIFWDPIDREYFTIKFNDAGVAELDQVMKTSYGDPENRFMDSNLQKLNSIIENKKDALEIQSMDEGTSDENILTSMVTENKLEEGMVHPTVDGTPTGEISEEYIDAYASKNKIVFDLQEYKNKGGKSAGYKYMTRTFLKNRLKNDNAPSMFKDTDAKKEKRDRKTAFDWFDKYYEKGNKTMPARHRKYLDEWLISKETVVAEAN